MSAATSTYQSSGSVADITFEISIGGNVIPATQFDITSGSQGSAGSCSITTSQSLLKSIKVDLFDISSTTPGFTEVYISVQTSQGGPQQSTIARTSTGGPGGTDKTQVKIFGGEYLNTTWNADTDSVVIKCRDWAGQLLDQKRILTKIGKAVESLLRPLAPGRVSAAGISNENQKVSNIVTSIAEEFGFNPILNLSEGKGDTTIGTLYGGGDQSFIPLPQSLWNILNQIARDTGYTVYVTPTKDLVFGEPGVGLNTIYLSHSDPNPPNGYVPCKGLSLEHHPRRNSTFRVVVVSYDAGHAQSVVGRAAYIGGNYANQHGLTSGVVSGQAAVSADKQLAALDAKVGQVALYTVHLDGLNQQQADQRAATMATDIAKREVLLTCSIDGLANILPTQQVSIEGQFVPNQMSAPTYYVSQYHHTFTLPRGSGDTGWMTHMTALNVPIEPGTGDAGVATLRGKTSSKTGGSSSSAGGTGGRGGTPLASSGNPPTLTG